MRRRSWKIVAGTGAAAALAALVLAYPASAGAANSPADLVPALAQPQSAGDVVPEHVDLVPLNISPQSTRSLGADDLAQYWVGQDESGRICLVMAVESAADVAAAACATPTDFYHHGARLQAGAGGNEGMAAAEAYLLPAGVRASELALGEAATHRDGITSEALVTGRPGELPRELPTLQREDGTPFQPIAFPAVPGSTDDR